MKREKKQILYWLSLNWVLRMGLFTGTTRDENGSRLGKATGALFVIHLEYAFSGREIRHIEGTLRLSRSSNRSAVPGSDGGFLTAVRKTRIQYAVGLPTDRIESYRTLLIRKPGHARPIAKSLG
jgi:hypothetical protein